MRDNYKKYLGHTEGTYKVTKEIDQVLILSCTVCNSDREIKRNSKFPKYCKNCEKNKIIPLDILSLDTKNFENCDIVEELSATRTLNLSSKKIVIKCRCCNNEETVNYTSFFSRKYPYICKKMRKIKSKLSSIRIGIKKRCYQVNSKGYSRYGGRGITMCEDWVNTPSSFIDWALNNGYKEDLQIDRIDNEGNYKPNNCRFVTNLVNSRNKSNTVINKEIVLRLKNNDWGNLNYKEIAEELGLDGIKNVSAVWSILNGHIWKEI